MSSLFGITEKYNYLLSQIEENEGELTPELEEELNITADELEDKLRAYRQVIIAQKANIDYNKDEIKRLRERNSGFEKTRDRLLKSVVKALHTFGNVGKNGNYSLKFPDFTVYTKETESINIDENSLNDVVNDLINSKALHSDPDKFNIVTCNMDYFSKIAKIHLSVDVPLLSIEDFIKYIKDNRIANYSYEIKFDKKAIKELDDYAMNCNNESETSKISDVMDLIDMNKVTSETAIYK